MIEEPLVSCQNVSKRFCKDFRRSLYYGHMDSFRDLLGINSGYEEKRVLRKKEFLSVDNVSFELRRGESLGLIGRNGAGKTTLLKMLNGLIRPDAGKITIRGRVGALIALGAGFNPVLTARENIVVNGSILGLSRQRIREVFDDIVTFAEIEEFVDSPVRTFSSGMKVRLGFAIAAHIEPDILLIDEVLAVGDLDFRRRCLRFIENFRQNGGAFILVTHNLNQILSSCDKAVLLENGKMELVGQSAEVVKKAIELQFAGKIERQPTDRSRRNRDKSPFIIVSGKIVGQDGSRLESGKTAIVELTVRCEMDANDLTWGVYIWTDDYSRRLLSRQSSDFGLNEQVHAGKEYIIRCEIPFMPLAPGRYGIRFTLNAGGELRDWVGYEDDFNWADIYPVTSSKNEVRAAAVGDLVWAECRWIKAEEV